MISPSPEPSDPLPSAHGGRRTWSRRPVIDRLWNNPTIRAAMGTSGANVAILGINLLTGVITARLLAPDGRGALAAITMWPQFLGFALGFGIPTALVYHNQQGIHTRRHLVSAASWGGLIAGGLGAIIGTLLLPWLLTSYSRDVVRVAQACMIFTPFGLLLNILSSAFLQEGTIARYNYVRLAVPVVTLAVLALLAVTRQMSVEAAALAYLLPNIPVTLWAVRTVNQQIGFTAKPDLSATKALLSYGLRYYGAEVAGTLSSQLDRVLVVWLLTPAAMGLYVVALSFSRVFQQLPVSIATVLLPKAASKTPQEAINLSFKVALIAAVLSLGLALPALLFGSFFLRVFFGGEFAAANNAFVVLTIEAVVGGVAIVLGQAFLAIGRPARMSFYQIVGLATIAPLLLWLGPRYGILGAGLSMLGSTTIRVILMLYGIMQLRRSLKSSGATA